MKRPSAKKASKPERAVLKSGLEKTKKVGLRAKWCETCNQLKRDGPRHKFDFPTHTLRPLVAAEREAYAEELSQDPTQYKLNFGKHKKKSLVWVRTHAPSYLAWMVRERVYDKRPQLKEALVSQNFFPASLLNIEDEKERCKRALSVIDSWQSGDKDKETAMAMPSESDVDKKVVPCSPEVLPAEEQGPLPKKSEKKQRHLKYMHPDQQTEAYANRTRLSLVERKHSGQQLHRMSALQFAQVMVEYGLLEDLTGLPCPFEDCSDKKQQKGYGFGSGSVLGGLSASSVGKSPGSEITLKDCCYRCLRCRRRVAVTANNVVFPPTARGGYGPTSLGFSA